MDHSHHMMMDNKTMDHSAHMNHNMSGTTMGDHSGHNMNHDMSMMMIMHFGISDTVVFKFWKADNVGLFLVSCTVLMFIGIFYEALKFLREKVSSMRGVHSISNTGNTFDMSKPKGSAANSSQAQLTYFQKLISPEHLIKTLIHCVQFTIGYFLMLAFMTYNYWICLFIIIGVTIGYFFFGVNRSVYNADIEDCCH